MFALEFDGVVESQATNYRSRSGEAGMVKETFLDASAEGDHRRNSGSQD